MPKTAFNNASAGNVKGRVYCVEYVNDEAPKDWRSQACGQAACATAVATLKNSAVGVDFTSLFSPPWNPDAGWLGFGTTPSRVSDIITNKYKKGVYKIYGRPSLQHWLGKNYPVICLIDNPPMKKTGDGMHWVVAYGYSPWNIFLSNFRFPGYEKDAEAAEGGSNVCPWGAFEAGWGSFTLNALGMSKRAFVIS